MSRRLIGAGQLALAVFTGLGHSLSGNPLADPTPPDGCVAGSRTVSQVGNLQTGFAGAPLGSTLRLAISCRSTLDGRTRAEAGLQVTWSVASGGGVLEGGTEVQRLSEPDGLASVNWSLGETVGTQSVTAVLEGKSYAFQATAVAPAPGGRCGDTLAGTRFDALRRVAGSETWTLAGSPYHGQAVEIRQGTLRIEPGVQVCLDSLVVEGGQLLARGTAAEPVRLQGGGTGAFSLRVAGTGFEPRSELAHVLATGVSSLNLWRPAWVEDSEFEADPAVPCALVALDTLLAVPASEPTLVRRSSFRGFGGTAPACPGAVMLRLTGLPAGSAPSRFAARVTGSRGVGVYVHPLADRWQLEQCELSGNAGPGLRAEADLAGISACSLAGNGGPGIENPNPGLYTVNARANWWGSAEGPLGPGGDGVSAGVDTAAPLPAPPVLGY